MSTDVQPRSAGVATTMDGRIAPVAASRRLPWRLALGGALLAVGAALASPPIAAQSSGSHATPGSKLIEFRRVGAWEIWCVDVGGSGRVDCDLNIVLNYVPNPRFRGMIPRIYLDDDGAPFLRLDYELQTSFARGYVRVDDGAPMSLADCDRPCVIAGAEARVLIDRLAAGRSASLHFHDYVVESFDVPIDLDGFAEGLAALARLQAQYRP